MRRKSALSIGKTIKIRKYLKIRTNRATDIKRSKYPIKYRKID